MTRTRLSLATALLLAGVRNVQPRPSVGFKFHDWLQAVHRIMELRRADSWGADRRESRLVFIGRNLDRDALERGLRGCLAAA